MRARAACAKFTYGGRLVTVHRLAEHRISRMVDLAGILSARAAGSLPEGLDAVVALQPGSRKVVEVVVEVSSTRVGTIAVAAATSLLRTSYVGLRKDVAAST